MPVSEQWNHVTLRDGRVGRDPSEVTDEGGPVLMEFDADRWYVIGERLKLPDGSEVEVVGERTQSGPLELVDGGLRLAGQATQTLFVDDIWDEPSHT